MLAEYSIRFVAASYSMTRWSSLHQITAALASRRPGRAEQGIALPYEEVARVPLIMRFPKRIPEGRVWQSGVNLAALAPTILDAAYISLTRGLPGYDQTPIIHLTSLLQTLLQADPAEWMNIYSRQPQLVLALARQLENWARRTQDNIGLELAHHAQVDRQ